MKLPARLVRPALTNWHYAFALLAICLLIVGWDYSFRNEPVIVHFARSAFPADVHLKNWGPVVLLKGQFKSLSGGFVAGEPIEIFMTIKGDSVAYARLQDVFRIGGATPVENSEPLEKHEEDRRENYQNSGLDTGWVTPGTIRVLRWHDTVRTGVFEGTIVFTEAGTLAFGGPLKFYLDQYGIKNITLEVAPRYVQYQLNAARRVAFAGWVALAISSLSLFFTLGERRKRSRAEEGPPIPQSNS